MNVGNGFVKSLSFSRKNH